MQNMNTNKNRGEKNEGWGERKVEEAERGERKERKHGEGQRESLTEA